MNLIQQTILRIRLFTQTRLENHQEPRIHTATPHTVYGADGKKCNDSQDEHFKESNLFFFAHFAQAQAITKNTKIFSMYELGRYILFTTNTIC